MFNELQWKDVARGSTGRDISERDIASYIYKANSYLQHFPMGHYVETLKRRIKLMQLLKKHEGNPVAAYKDNPDLFLNQFGIDVILTALKDRLEYL